LTCFQLPFNCSLFVIEHTFEFVFELATSPDAIGQEVAKTYSIYRATTSDKNEFITLR